MKAADMNTPEQWAENFPAPMRRTAAAVIRSAMDERHKATWDMAMEAAADKLSNMMERDTWTGYAAITLDEGENPATIDKDPCKFYLVSTVRRTLVSIHALACPPLETGE